MPRYPVIEKTINGSKVTQEVFLNTICEAIAAVEGGAKVGDILSTLGPEWDNAAGRKVVGQSILNLHARGLLLRGVEPGIYMVNTNRYKRKGVTRRDEDEKAILGLIRKRGGFARFRDIMEDLGLRPTGDAEDRLIAASQPAYRRVITVLKDSERIRQDITTRGMGTGVYNAPWEELAALPIIGHYANLYIRYTYEQIRAEQNNRAKLAGLEPKLRTGRYDYFEEREPFFEHVGSAFYRLRRIAGMTAQELIDHKPVRAAIATFYRAADTAHGPVKVIRQEWFDHMEVEIDKMRASVDEDDGRPLSARQADASRRIEAYRVEQAQVWETKRSLWLYRHFEKGTPGAHMFAPLTLYTTIAELFEVCPAALSRGFVALKPTLEKIKPEDYRRTMDEIIAAELANEAADEQREQLLAASVEDLAEK